MIILCLSFDPAGPFICPFFDLALLRCRFTFWENVPVCARFHCAASCSFSAFAAALRNAVSDASKRASPSVAAAAAAVVGPAPASTSSSSSSAAPHSRIFTSGTDKKWRGAFGRRKTALQRPPAEESKRSGKGPYGITKHVSRGSPVEESGNGIADKKTSLLYGVEIRGCTTALDSGRAGQGGTGGKARAPPMNRSTPAHARAGKRMPRLRPCTPGTSSRLHASCSPGSTTRPPPWRAQSSG